MKQIMLVFLKYLTAQLILRCAIPVVRLNYMVRWIQSKNTTIKYG